MRHARIRSLLLLTIVAGCSLPEGNSPSGVVSVAPAPSTPASAASAGPRQPLPDGFPVLAGAVAVAMPGDDADLIGLWRSDQVGSAAYDFYVQALPAAGYPIIGLYPGGTVALIRFQAPTGGVWQVVAHSSPADATTIEVRLDRP